MISFEFREMLALFREIVIIISRNHVCAMSVMKHSNILLPYLSQKIKSFSAVLNDCGILLEKQIKQKRED